MVDESIVNGFIYAHSALGRFLPMMFQGNQAQRQQAYTNMKQTITEVGRLANVLKTQKVAMRAEELVKFANYLDSNGFYALADQITEMIILVKEANDADIIPIEDARNKKNVEKKYDEVSEERSGEGYALASILRLIAQRLKQHADQLEWGKTEELKPKIYEDMRFMSDMLHKYSDKMKDVKTFSSSINDLVSIGNWLDENGFHALADRVDTSVGLIKTAEDYGYCPQMSAAQENTAVFQPLSEGSLSSRYCPDHVGVQTIRIDPHTVQCPLDGKEYNYESGYVNYEGQRVPGGSVAAQTPKESNYGGIPMRFYDSRSDVLSRLT